MDLVIICCAALLASLLTFFSGFGLNTVLLPVFAFFFPLPQAISLTAIVHLCNNIFKSRLVYKDADWNVGLKFGIFTVPAALLGALLLEYAAQIPPITSYTFLFERKINLSWQGIFIGALMIFFALYELLPVLEKKIPTGKRLWVGGIISGFLGGFSGHQGAIRSAFLLRIFKEKEKYIATGIMIAFLVDITRLIIYSSNFKHIDFSAHWKFLVLPVLCAFAGAYAGNKLLKKITLKFVSGLVCALLIVFGVLTISGILAKS